MSTSQNFDRIARVYRWMEYLSFGPMLERCRFYFLPRLPPCKNALVYGDGDGRFITRLLLQQPKLRADAIDSSAEMLALLRKCCERAGVAARLTTRHADALAFTPAVNYDLVATHFFLDCFTQSQLQQLIEQITPALAPNALWLVSDFCIPDGIMHWPARILVRSLYIAFRRMTGLCITQLPDHAAALHTAGFIRTSQASLLSGILFTEVWQKSSTIEPAIVTGQ